MKAVLTSPNTAFLPAVSVTFQATPNSYANFINRCLRFCVNFWVIFFVHFGKEIFFSERIV